MHTDQEINHAVLVTLLRQIRDILSVEKEEPDSLKADEVRAALRNELSGVIKAVKAIPETDNKDILKELKALKDAINAIEVKPNISVEAAEVNVPDVIVPEIKLPEFNIPTPQVNYTPPSINIPTPVVNVPAPIVNVPEIDLDVIVRGLQDLYSSLDKLRTNNKSRPLAVRLTDGSDWIKELVKTQERVSQAVAAFAGGSDQVRIVDSNKNPVNPASEDTLQQILGKYAVRLDDVSTTNVTYVGKARIGSSGASALWQVMKMDESGTPETLVITYADGNSNFDNIWDNRTSLTYS